MGTTNPKKSRPRRGKKTPSRKRAAPKAKAEPTAEASPLPKPRGILRDLGIIGFEEVEPIILGALATDSTLLLIGPHGAAKTYLLERLAEALGLTCRHYNASIVNFDDLIGFPVPDGEGGVKYARTPDSIWEANAVFVDEISRCRPEVQNKFFPLIHERRVQGVHLEALRHRWAAMNPPAGDEDADDTVYLGSEPLDPALADRFAFIVEVPTWASFTEEDRRAIIRAQREPIGAESRHRLEQRLQEIRETQAVVERALGDALATYVLKVEGLARQADITLSARRCNTLHRALITTHAAQYVASPSAKPEDSAWLALCASLPQRAEGKPIDRSRLFQAHRTAWNFASRDGDDPLCLILAEPDPVKRAIRATQVEGLASDQLSDFIADGLAEATPGGRHALALHLQRHPVAAELNAAVAEQISELAQYVLVKQDVHRSCLVGSQESNTWGRVVSFLGELNGREDQKFLGNLLPGLFNRSVITSEEDLHRVHSSWVAVRELLGKGL